MFPTFFLSSRVILQSPVRNSQVKVKAPLKRNSSAEHEYMNIPPPPSLPINVPATALGTCLRTCYRNILDKKLSILGNKRTNGKVIWPRTYIKREI